MNAVSRTKYEDRAPKTTAVLASSTSSDASTPVLVTRVYAGSSGGAVFMARDRFNISHRYVADRETLSRVPLIGEVWAVEGCHYKHPQYGAQISVTRAVLTRPSQHLLYEFIIHLKIGVGHAKVARLRELVGGRLSSVLDLGDAEALMPALTLREAERLLVAWKDCAEEVATIRFLDKHGFPSRLVSKIRDFWGTEAVAKLEDNPYRLLAFAPWCVVDTLAHSLGIASEDPRRLVAAVEAQLYARLDQHHTWTGREMLIGIVAQILGNTQVAERSIAMSCEAGAAVEINGGYQPVGVAFMERRTESYLASMLPAPQGTMFAGGYRRAAVEESISRFEADANVHLADEQRAAVLMSVSENRFSVITGGAGVGKTTVLAIICRVYEACAQKPLLMALSGRATQRLREATGAPAITIAAFLAAVAKGKGFRPGEEPVVILDEASMLDLPLTHRLLRALPTGSRLLMVGDPHQLPPIGFGLVFQVAAASDTVPRVELTQVHRQVESTGIPAVALAVRQGVTPLLPDYSGKRPGVSFVECSPRKIADTLTDIAGDLGGFAELQILCATKRGEAGTTTLNEHFHQIFGSHQGHEGEFTIGEPLIYLRNDYQRGLYNGSLGRVLELNTSEDLCLVCEFDARRHNLEATDLPNIALAYAVTVHKAQGSQFQRVLIPVAHSRLLDRTLLYTALTRGREQVVLVGDFSAFREAVKAPPSTFRREVAFRI